MAKKCWITPRNLRDAVSRNRLLHQQEVKLFSRNTVFDYQSSFLDKLNSTHTIGIFYEMISMSFYGGKKHCPVGVGRGSSDVVVVDLLNDDEIRECKAYSFNGNFNLRDNQIEKQIRLAEAGYKLKYDFYVHTAGRFEKQAGENRIYEGLADKTLCSIVLPFDLVLQLHRSRDSALVSRYEGKGEKNKEPSTILLSPTVAMLFYSPEKVLGWLNLNPDNYEVERKVSPLKFQVEGNPVKQFPILYVHEKKED